MTATPIPSHEELLRERPKQNEPELWRRRRLIRESSLTAQQKLLLYVLADYIGKKTSCYPASSTLADDIGLKVRQLHNLLKELRDLGIVERKRRGRGDTNLTAVIWDRIPQRPDAHCSAGLDAQSNAIQTCGSAAKTSANGESSSSRFGLSKRASPMLVAMLDELSDGKPHARCELFSKFNHLIPPEYAARACERKDRALGRKITRGPVDKVIAGKARLFGLAIKSALKRGSAERVFVDGIEYLKLKQPPVQADRTDGVRCLELREVSD